VHKDETRPAWRDNPRRFLLIGRPQIGKTGVFLWLVWLMWKQYNTSSAADAALAEIAVDVDELEEFHEEEEEETLLGTGGEKFPKRVDVKQQGFLHPPTGDSGYGCLNDAGQWKHFLGYKENGTWVRPRPPPYIKPDEGGFKKRSEASSAANPSNAAAESDATPVVSSERPVEGVETSPKEQLSVQWLCRGPKEPIPLHRWKKEREERLEQRKSAPERYAEPIKVPMGVPTAHILDRLKPEVRKLAEAGGGDVGELHLTAANMNRHWEAVGADGHGLSHRLKFDSNNEDVLTFPIMTPSSGRASVGLLDLSATMVDLQGNRKKYVQIVCVKKEEAEWYMGNWPEHDFFVMPQWADKLGVGIHRFCLKRLAELICPEAHRLCLMVDDNVLNWVGITLIDDTERLFGAPPPMGSNAKCRRHNRPMWEALSYLQDEKFVDRPHFAMLGFQRLGNPKYHNNLKAPFARSHVYKCYLLNLNKLRGRDFDGAVWAVEDVDFTKRLICDCFPPPDSKPRYGELCLASHKAPPERCASWASDDPGLNSRQSELVCKIRRFGFFSKKLPGGASGTAEDGPQEEMPPVLPTPVQPASDDFAAWLRALPSFGKSTEDEMDALVAQLKGVAVQDFLYHFSANGHGAVMKLLKDSFNVSPAHALKIANAVQQLASQ